MSKWGGVVRDPTSPVVFPTTFGADPTGKQDSSAAFAQAMNAVIARALHNMSDGIRDLGGVVLDLQGGEYLISSPLQVPQFVGNLRIIDGTLRASRNFPPESFVLQVGALPCKTPSGQGSCNENVGLSGLTLDAGHVAQGCLSITATMGATLDSSSAIFGFTGVGILLRGGHESMISETWVAAYFWSEKEKERTNSTGILVAGNDHFLSDVIVFSARVGVQLTGAANKLVNVHTWNEATGNGGKGIVNSASQNIFYGCYLDFTDFILEVAQQVSFSGGFFLGNAQFVFAAQQPEDKVVGVSLSGNVWYDCGLPSLAVNETLGSWTSVTDLDFSGTAFCSASPQTGLPAATRVLYNTVPPGPDLPATVLFDFSSVLLFPKVAIVDASVKGLGCAEWIPNVLSLQGALVNVSSATACQKTVLWVDQSKRSTWSTQPT